MYTPIPAGFVLSEEKSAPSAEKALPIDENRAVPLFIRKEYLSASVSFCAKVVSETNNPNAMIIVFFITSNIYQIQKNVNLPAAAAAVTAASTTAASTTAAAR
ncbi:hypothetical protein SDC9_95775 [bioreactor metagenome]|uniref:Uncharacterized protein n=1 Tax=bioreactor metagenome TaxID=1076179 RepID=A0A645A7K4_9ZZZZ